MRMTPEEIERGIVAANKIARRLIEAADRYAVNRDDALGGAVLAFESLSVIMSGVLSDPTERACARGDERRTEVANV